MLIFEVVTVLMTYLILRFQNFLPLNPQHCGSDGSLAFNTAELRHQYQLAKLWRRIDHELFVANAGPGVA